jgi:hypothetical protein
LFGSAGSSLDNGFSGIHSSVGAMGATAGGGIASAFDGATGMTHAQEKLNLSGNSAMPFGASTSELDSKKAVWAGAGAGTAALGIAETVTGGIAAAKLMGATGTGGAMMSGGMGAAASAFAIGAAGVGVAGGVGYGAGRLMVHGIGEERVTDTLTPVFQRFDAITGNAFR